MAKQLIKDDYIYYMVKIWENQLDIIRTHPAFEGMELNERISRTLDEGIKTITTERS